MDMIDDKLADIDITLPRMCRHAEAMAHALSCLNLDFSGPRVVDEPKKPTPKVIPVFTESITEKKRRRRKLRREKSWK